LSASGWPIVGDSVYGTPDPQIGRQALHAWRIEMPHPLTRQPLSLVAPVPPDIGSILTAYALPMGPDRRA
jgi:23S rRNA pseudouridine1911/1915/1917 synthase